MVEDRGSYIPTFTGKKFFVASPRTEDIDPVDIIWSLAFRCRWCCFCNRFYCVAEHTTIVNKIIETHFLSGASESERRLILSYSTLHDAHEAYLPDLSTPIKIRLQGWKGFEDKIDVAILDRFNLGFPDNDIKRIVKTADMWAAGMEADAIISMSKEGLDHPIPPDPPEDVAREVVIDPSYEAGGQFAKVRASLAAYFEFCFLGVDLSGL